MRDIIEFRVDEQFAPLLFAENEGKKLGDSVRRVTLQSNDPRYKRVGELQKILRQREGKPFFFGWSISHKYSSPEIEAASLLHLKITSVFEPAGEECGTRYNESIACIHCRAGANQITPLFLKVNRIPKNKDVSRTIAGEVVVSRRVVELFERHRITGAEFSPVHFYPSSSSVSKDWFQIIIPNAITEIIAPTRIGIDPFDDDENSGRCCPKGDLIGPNLLSEVFIEFSSRPNIDIICSRQFVGVRRGLLRPERLIFVTPKLRRLIESEKLKGIEVEVAHLVK